jgi:hypothetical protein
MPTFRMMLSLAAHEGWHILATDCTQAFANAKPLDVHTCACRKVFPDRPYNGASCVVGLSHSCLCCCLLPIIPVHTGIGPPAGMKIRGCTGCFAQTSGQGRGQPVCAAPSRATFWPGPVRRHSGPRLTTASSGSSSADLRPSPGQLEARAKLAGLQVKLGASSSSSSGSGSGPSSSSSSSSGSGPGSGAGSSSGSGSSSV